MTTSTSFYSLTAVNEDVRKIIRRILKDIRVEMGDEFDRNFKRQAFFSAAWQRRKSPIRDKGRALLIDTSQLRRSISSRTTENSIIFYTDLPYAAIHNDGGEIVVTKRMKGYFWHKYMTASGVLAFARRKDGSMRRDKKTLAIHDEAEFWKFMALMKEGKRVVIPRRRFLGYAPEVEAAAKRIIEDNLTEFFDKEFNLTNK